VLAGESVPDDDTVWRNGPLVTVAVRSTAVAVVAEELEDRVNSQPANTATARTGSSTTGRMTRRRIVVSAIALMGAIVVTGLRSVCEVAVRHL
jgi:hypothetical protein